MVQWFDWREERAWLGGAIWSDTLLVAAPKRARGASTMGAEARR